MLSLNSISNALPDTVLILSFFPSENTNRFHILNTSFSVEQDHKILRLMVTVGESQKHPKELKLYLDKGYIPEYCFFFSSLTTNYFIIIILQYISSAIIFMDVIVSTYC